MSKNLQVLKTGYQDFAKGDIAAVLATYHPDIEWIEPEGSPYAGIFLGHDGVVGNVFSKLKEDWNEFGVTPSEFIDGGDRIVVLGKATGSSKSTGKSLNADFAHIWTMRDGVAVRFLDCSDTAAMRAALGK